MFVFKYRHWFKLIYEQFHRERVDRCSGGVFLMFIWLNFDNVVELRAAASCWIHQGASVWRRLSFLHSRRRRSMCFICYQTKICTTKWRWRLYPDQHTFGGSSTQMKPTDLGRKCKPHTGRPFDRNQTHNLLADHFSTMPSSLKPNWLDMR